MSNGERRAERPGNAEQRDGHAAFSTVELCMCCTRSVQRHRQLFDGPTARCELDL